MSGWSLPSLGAWLHQAMGAALDLLYPPACAVCGVSSPPAGLTHLCPRCAEKLPRLVPPYCQVCGEWFVGATSEAFRCANCAHRRFDFEFAFAPMKAHDAMRELIHRYKYEKALWLRVTMAELLTRALRGPMAEPRLANESGWIAVPVPLHARRLREREFNQAAEICRVLARLTGIPMREALIRTRYTTVQATLQRQERLDNLRGAFALSRRERHSRSLLGRAILLVDDVFTTGATSQECARILKREAGARRVAVLTVARG